ncbi:CGNR zinc finger domain-containing protein [Amycolatopsis sp. FDAARGOS 1241]|uniref:CGNR zinc finger domain-containing protein n=1 Tax=Amycolatopsis sp. FDAARGOS 1241 TaxID=2778070 RepID=UPI00194DE921|nr:CGNR zinc finger domain-containing protein [Amycolatopsis sp. FDAARGOS 1241]QRP49936.1 CGNR zinc finger domain-containing protein [Amycolatopsis sp. FDAARGOS 1241]
MHFNPYGGSGAQVAAALATLVRGERPTGDDVLHTCRDHGMSLAGLTGDEAARILAWGRKLRAVFAADPSERVDLVNHLLATAAFRPHISSHDGKPPHLHYASEHAGAVGRVQAHSVGGLAHLVCEAPDRLGVCAREGCGIAFVDTSRNGRRRFCSTRCGTRVNVADHRARKISA